MMEVVMTVDDDLGLGQHRIIVEEHLFNNEKVGHFKQNDAYVQQVDVRVEILANITVVISDEKDAIKESSQRQHSNLPVQRGDTASCRWSNKP
jgi:hypothetical protein